MTDSDQRERVLRVIYENRRDRGFIPSPQHFDPSIVKSEIVRLCGQLQERRLINVVIQNFIDGGATITGCSITAEGAEMIENNGRIAGPRDGLSNNTINFSGSGNLILGSNNQISIQNSIQELARVIDSSTASPEEKAEAKGLLKKFLEHPLLSAVAGGALGMLG